jgi:hypothetical protein
MTRWANIGQHRTLPPDGNLAQGAQPVCASVYDIQRDQSLPLVFRHKETTMTNRHPVHDLQANLEAARLKVVETLAAKEDPPAPDALRELATIHAALSAVREEIATHGVRLGWGATSELE